MFIYSIEFGSEIVYLAVRFKDIQKMAYLISVSK